MTVTLTKREAARRQIKTAIELFFADGDPVSVYSLTANGWEIVDLLCTRAGIDSVSNQTREHAGPEKDLKRDYINSPYRNFFKHADRDPDGVLEGFNDKLNDAILFLAVEDYIRLFESSPVEFQVFNCGISQHTGRRPMRES